MESTTARVSREPESRARQVFNYLESLRGEALALALGALMLLVVVMTATTFYQRNAKLALQKKMEAEVRSLNHRVGSLSDTVKSYADANRSLNTELNATNRAMKAMRPTIVQRHYHITKPAPSKASTVARAKKRR